MKHRGIEGVEMARSIEASRDLAMAIAYYLHTTHEPHCAKMLARIAKHHEHRVMAWDALAPVDATERGGIRVEVTR